MSGKGRWIALAVLLLVGVAAGLGLPRLHAMAEVGAGYVAKQACSCVFVAGRDLEACRSDMLPVMSRVRAELLPARRGVRAWLPLLAERVARHHGETGCTLH